VSGLCDWFCPLPWGEGVPLPAHSSAGAGRVRGYFLGRHFPLVERPSGRKTAHSRRLLIARYDSPMLAAIVGNPLLPGGGFDGDVLKIR
jgi:hypothetical protein